MSPKKRRSLTASERLVVVAVITWDLHLNGCASLKDKRRIIKSLKDRLHHRFNVSVAETASHDRWQRAEFQIVNRGTASAFILVAEDIGFIEDTALEIPASAFRSAGPYSRGFMPILRSLAGADCIVTTMVS